MLLLSVDRRLHFVFQLHQKLILPPAGLKTNRTGRNIFHYHLLCSGDQKRTGKNDTGACEPDGLMFLF